MRQFKLDLILNDECHMVIDTWSGNIGTIIKMKLKKMLSETEHKGYHKETLKKHISDLLTNMETNIELSETLLCSYPPHLRSVENANGSHTDYWLYSSNLKKIQGIL